MKNVLVSLIRKLNKNIYPNTKRKWCLYIRLFHTTYGWLATYKKTF